MARTTEVEWSEHALALGREWAPQRTVGGTFSERPIIVTNDPYGQRTEWKADGDNEVVSIVSKWAVPEPTMHPAQAKSVKAVVTSVGSENVQFRCLLEDRSLSVQFPSSIVPDELRVYGHPVLISLSFEGGYRIPKITGRMPDHLDPSPELNDLSDWANSI